MFDRESASACHAELIALPRVATGRCKLVTIGMRIDARTRAAQVLREWSEALGVPHLGALRETQLYVRSLEKGLTIFDLPLAMTATDLQQWEPILNWLRPVLYPPQAANDAVSCSPLVPQRPPVLKSAVNPGYGANHAATFNKPARSALPSSLLPAQETMLHGDRLSVLGSNRASLAPIVASNKPALTRNVNSPDSLQIPQFLKRASN